MPARDFLGLLDHHVAMERYGRVRACAMPLLRAINNTRSDIWHVLRQASEAARKFRLPLGISIAVPPQPAPLTSPQCVQSVAAHLILLVQSLKPCLPD